MNSTSIATSATALIAVAATMAFYLQFHSAGPDEWMLVIRDGQMVRAGVGMQHFSKPGQQVVKFPSSLEKFQFSAQQVTREMQGIEVKGFAIWGVYREGAGPFNAYKYLDGLSPDGRYNANNNLANMAESILRTHVANMTIEQVLTQRKGMREQLTTQMMEVVQGWGIWLETVEVTDVKILSNSLFNNLQTKFREETRQTAEQLRLQVQKEIELAKAQHDLAISKSTTSAARERAVHQLQQQVAEHEEKAAAEAQQHKLTLEQRARDHELALQKFKEEAELRAAVLAEQLEVKLKTAQVENQIQQIRLETERTMDTVNVENARMQMLKEIYAALPLQELKVVNVAGDNTREGNSSLAGGLLLPGLAASLLG